MIIATPATAGATPLPPKVFVGYADDLRANPSNFPTPWSGSPGVGFIGSPAPWDAGTIMLQNPNATPLAIDGVNVDLQRPGPTFNVWGTFSIPAHGTTILTQSTQYDFDTSEAPALTACGVAAPATLDPPKVTVTIAGASTDFIDSGHVLDTSGYDKACVGNESTQWTPVGSAPCPGSSLVASPPSQAAAPGATVTVTARFANSCGTALSGVVVHFTVTSGPHAGITGNATTNSNGVAAFHYSGTPQGIDNVQASISNTVGILTSNSVNVLWETATLSVNPTAGLPGDTIAFPAPSPGTAAGYLAGETVDLHANSPTGAILTSVVANGSGAISGSFVVPVPAAGGQMVAVVAVGATSARQGWAVFTGGCTTDWTSTSGGDFNDATKWSTGAVPGPADLVCIIAAGTYTVSVTTSESVAGLVLGHQSSGAQTLNLGGRGLGFQIGGSAVINPAGVLVMDSPDGNSSLIGGPGTLTNNGTLSTVNSNGGPRYIRINVVNNATATIDNFNTLLDSATTFTNTGALSIGATGGLALTGSSTFTESAGTLAVAGTLTVTNSTFNENGGTETGASIVLTSSTLNDSAGTASFLLQCSNTVAGTIHGGQRVTVQGNTCGNGTVTFAGTSVANNGTLTLDSSNGNYALLQGAPLINSGTLSTIQGKGGQRYIRVNLTNNPGAKVTISNFDTRIDTATTTINNGTFTVAATGALAVSGGGIFTQGAGTLTNSGSFSATNTTFNHNGGAASGNAVSLSGSTLNDNAASNLGFLVQCSDTLTGTISASQTVTVQGNNSCGAGNLTLAGASVTNNGTIVLESLNGTYSLIAGAPLTNNGTFRVTQGNGGPRYIRVNLTNASTGSVTLANFDTRFDQGTTTVNSGAFTVAGGGGVSITSGIFTQAAGTLVNNGAINANSVTFNQNGGTASGTAVVLTNSTLTDSAGIGNFLMQCGGTLGGTIAAGQTVTIQANAVCGSAVVNLAAPGVTNNGTLAMDSTNTGFALLQGAALTNNGNFNLVQDAGGIRYLRVPVFNTATMTIGAVDTRQDAGTATSNTGTVSVLNGANLTLGGGSSYSQTAAATLNVSVAAGGGTFGIIAGGGNVTVAGTLGVTTAGNPTIGSTFAVVSGAVVSGTFASVSSGATHYSTAYSASEVTLTRQI
jgi:fibronectin-binding autotransporter adhesin